MVFKKRAKSTGRDGNTVSHPPSVISKNLKITGDLVGDGDIHVSGTIGGNIKCGNLTVGEGAGVEGQIEATQVSIHGSVHGSINAKTVALHRTAKVVGDVAHETLEVESGAVLDGYYKRLAPQSTPTKEADAISTVAKPSMDGRSLSQESQPPQPRRGPLRRGGAPDTTATAGDSKPVKEKTLHAPK